MRESQPDMCNVDCIHLGAVKAAMRNLPPGESVSRAAELLGLLGNSTRLNILLALRGRDTDSAPELCVCDLAVVARSSKSMTSHQLRLLRTSGLVRQRRSGKLTYYRLVEGPLGALLDGVLALASATRNSAAMGSAAHSTAGKRLRA